MALNLGHLIWDSVNNLACDDKKAPIVCDVNARPASLVPRMMEGVSDLQWFLYDNVSVFPTDTGVRNGVAVTDSEGNIYVWDVQGDASSDEAENSPFAKLASFLELCKNCEDCDTAGVGTLNGEYNGTYNALPASSYCYTLTITSQADYPNASDIKNVELQLGNYLVGEVSVKSYNTGTDTVVYNVCLTLDVTSTGAPMGAPSNYAFASV
jgi:hypothetical protein